MAENRFDIVVVGSGPGGYVAAIRAAQLGMSAAVVERGRLGGVCLNWGCIPTKALLRASEIRHLLGDLDRFGFSANDISFDAKKVVARSRAVADRLSKGVRFLLRKNGVTVVEGDGALAGKGAVSVSGADGAETARLRAGHIVLATGARARTLPGIEPDGKRIWSYREAMVPERIPESALVIGSGAIGVEFASFYSDMGAETTVVEMLDRILPAEDAEISDFARKAFEKQGMTIHTGTTVKALEERGGRIAVRLDPAGDVTVETIILAVGIVGNTENLGLDGTGVRVERGHVVVDEWMRTGEPGVYAIGDAAGPPWLAHKASHEGVLCVERIAGVEGVHPLDTRNVPGCTYCRPQVASVGLTEAAARESGRDIRVGRFPFAGNGKAIALGEPEGLVKTVFDAATGELLGAHMIGAEVTELIQGYAVARTLEGTERDLMDTIFPHPTISEAMHESALDAWDRALHI